MKKRTLLRPKLGRSHRFLVIGLGGVGSIVARYGAVFLASLGKPGTLMLVDGDQFEPSNSSRMIFGRYGNKAQVVRRELLPRFRHAPLTILAYPKYVTPQNLRKLIRSGDVVFLCVDNHKTRKIISDHCRKLKNICLISGGNDGVGKDRSGKVRRGTYGNVQIHVRRKGRDRTWPITVFHIEIDRPTDKLPTELNCTELVVSTPQILFANLAVASAMLNTLLLYLSGDTHYSELSFDIAEGMMRPTLGRKP